MNTINTDILITVAIVVHNQSDMLQRAINEITSTLRGKFRFFEILIVDNGSTDDTYITITNLLQHNRNIRTLILSRHYDTEVGYMTVLDNCIGDFVVLMDIVTDPPTFIPSLISTAQRGYDVVKTNKLQKRKSKNATFREKIYAALYKYLLQYDVQADTSDFLIFSRRAVNSLILFRHKHRNLHYMSSIIGFRQCTLNYQPVARRRYGSRKLSTFTSARRFMDMLISNSTFPLRFAAFVGMTASFLSLLYLLYTFVVAIVKKRLAEGWLTTSVLNASMFFLLFIILTILAEYIDRLIHETKEQPMYIIAEELSSASLSKNTKRMNVK